MAQELYGTASNGTPPDWRSTVSDGGPLPSFIHAALVDMDLRIGQLPDGRQKEILSRWLTDVARGFALEAERWVRFADGLDGHSPEERRQALENEALVLRSLYAHVLQAEHGHRVFPLMFAACWTLGALLWVAVAVLLVVALPSVDSAETPELFGIPIQLWSGVFVAGLAGSATAVLATAYRGRNPIRPVFLAAPPEDVWRGEGSGISDRRLRRAYSLIAEAGIRAVIRPMLGGLFALGIFVLLLSGLAVEPLLAGLRDDAGVIEFENVNAVTFFLATAFVAGFSDDLAYGLFERALTAVSGSKSEA